MKARHERANELQAQQPRSPWGCDLKVECEACTFEATERYCPAPPTFKTNDAAAVQSNMPAWLKWQQQDSCKFPFVSSNLTVGSTYQNTSQNKGGFVGSTRKLGRETLSKLVKESDSLSSILRKMGQRISGSSYASLKNRLIRESIDFSHIPLGLGARKGKSGHNFRTIPLSEIMVENSKYASTNTLKKRLIQKGVLINRCAECKMEPFWNGKCLVLQLDHINGRRTDNRLKNLRLLCPNCHTQTETYSGKRFRKPRAAEIDPNWRNRTRLHKRKVERPSKEDLLKMVWETPSTELAKHFGVADTAIVKWCKIYGIQKPPLGYWSKNKSPNIQNMNKKGGTPRPMDKWNEVCQLYLELKSCGKVAKQTGYAPSTVFHILTKMDIPRFPRKKKEIA